MNPNHSFGWLSVKKVGFGRKLPFYLFRTLVKINNHKKEKKTQGFLIFLLAENLESKQGRKKRTLFFILFLVQEFGQARTQEPLFVFFFFWYLY